LFCVVGIMAILVPGWIAAGPFVRGDVNQDGTLDVSDPISILMYLFVEGHGAPGCLDAADLNDSGALEIGDGVFGLSYLFAGGPPPAAPFPACGEDLTADDLTCADFSNGYCPAPGPPTGELVDSTGCKTHLKQGDITNTQDCIVYDYDGTGLLTLKHVNAGFNCCAFAAVDIEIGEDSIIIMESETYDPVPCACLCLFDVDMEIRNLPPGEYLILVKGVVAPSPIEFVADLTHQTSGRYCVERDGYPWGVEW
jgi:hypothetical protein